MISRRRLLAGTLAATGLAVAGGAGVLGLPAPAVEGLLVLNAREYRTVSRLARALFPPGGAFAYSADAVDLARAFDAFLAGEPEWNRTDLRRGLALLELGPVIFEGRGTTFSHLSDEERLAHFERWGEADSAVRRQLATALRKFLTLFFYDQPGAWPGIGYDGPLLR